MSRTEYFVFVMDHTHKDIKEMGRRIAELEQMVALLEKELEQKNKIIVQKDKIIERQNRTIEQLEKKLEDCASKLFDCKNNKPKLSSKWSKILLAIPKAVEEGLTWNDLMRDLGILDPQEQVAVMQRFFITIDENGRIPEIIRPLPGIRELEGIDLYRKDGVNVRFAKIVREDTLKAAKSLDVPKPTEDGQPAVEVPRAKIEKQLKAWLKQYEQWASSWKTKEKAESFLKSVGNNGLKRLVREYGFDVVAEVVGSNADFRALFGPFLLKLEGKKVEVTSDV
ncbi:SlyX family protein [Thermococcus aciditolerans]|uniref:SlyX family protein n=1 Tax=Thermococcus aciditolerans TaxID=2598455 RepID=A0A5C0SJI9_9EURY|nr:SlyX family protein [Thermococcus aciditolerans]QEK14583.1 SlyX family protein [Thermococcus aciditolerans]